MTTSKPSIVRSMTGQGHASEQGELGTVSVEIRTVNNRGFKCTPRVSDNLATLESKIEALTRSLIHRGTVNLTVTWRRVASDSLPSVDVQALQAYVDQLAAMKFNVDLSPTLDLATLMTLPGVIGSVREDRRDDGQLWSFVEAVIRSAISNLDEMRLTEGGRMGETLAADCEIVAERLARIREIAPRAVESYRSRLESKIQRVLQEHDQQVQTVDLLREVQIYADRADISEEITRLGSHLRMFDDVLAGKEAELREPMGRKLDFILQEMFRETNTIGSKAADAEVSSHVVEIKCAIERMRELVQNLE
ncbi:MAG: YicC family protein [Rhodopirellula sp.]|nr:YicC family protein [Rhodopirellula sp.]